MAHRVRGSALPAAFSGDGGGARQALSLVPGITCYVPEWNPATGLSWWSAGIICLSDVCASQRQGLDGDALAAWEPAAAAPSICPSVCSHGGEVWGGGGDSGVPRAK